MKPRHSFSVWRPAPIIAIRPPEPRRSLAAPPLRPFSALLPDITTESGFKRLAGEDVGEMTEPAIRAEVVDVVRELDRLRAAGDAPRLFIVAGVIGRVDITDQGWMRQRWERLNAELERRRVVAARGGHAE